jgi:NDP-sugar pyrophosphorylase family protein
MAGGRSERMRKTGERSHKALLDVAGMTMLERNMRSVLWHGFKEVVVVSSAREPQIKDFVEGRGRELALAFGAHIECLVEAMPLGNVGIARELADRADAMLMVYVDNLTTLDLAALCARHHRQQPLITVAVHEETFWIPYGEVTLAGDRITEYEEKPERNISVSSGTYALSPRVRDFIPLARPTNIADLVACALRAGERVEAFFHNDAWVDVNDKVGLDRAEAMILRNRAKFEFLANEIPNDKVGARRSS